MFTSKKRSGLSDIEQKAKMKVLKDIHGKMEGILGDNLKGAQKVTVAADSKKGLQEGLDKAEDLLGEEDEDDSNLGEKDENDSNLGEKMEQMAEDYEDQQEESEPMDAHELEEKIKELMAMKAKLENK
jgi:hypothetical protein